MNKAPWEQYREVLDGLVRPPISTQWAKYDKFEHIAKILGNIFTTEVWKEWDNAYTSLIEIFEKKINPQAHDDDYKRIYEWVYPAWFPNPCFSPRLSSYLVRALSAFGIRKIDDYISVHNEALWEVFCHDDFVKFSGGWYNACETAIHLFQGFKPMLDRWIKEPSDLVPREMKKLIAWSALLDTATFDRHSIRNYNQNVHWILIHEVDESLGLEYIPSERVWCPAVRRFRWVPIDQTVFDELFTRICTIYWYNQVEGTIHSVIKQVHSTCPFHHPESSPSSQPPSEISKI